MRTVRPSPLTRPGLLPTPLALLPLLALLSLLPCSPAIGAVPATAVAADPASPAPVAPVKGQTVVLNGSVAAGLDKSLIKDQTQGYFVVEGVDLLRFAGRRIQARGVVLGQEQGFAVVRLLEYSITSPDDESPGASTRQGR